MFDASNQRIIHEVLLQYDDEENKRLQDLYDNNKEDTDLLMEVIEKVIVATIDEAKRYECVKKQKETEVALAKIVHNELLGLDLLK